MYRRILTAAAVSFLLAGVAGLLIGPASNGGVSDPVAAQVRGGAVAYCPKNWDTDPNSFACANQGCTGTYCVKEFGVKGGNTLTCSNTIKGNQTCTACGLDCGSGMLTKLQGCGN